MIAVILNSGRGTRLGNITRNKPKCMLEILDGQTIIEYQLRLLSSNGIRKVIITTGYEHKQLEHFLKELKMEMEMIFIENPQYESTNYIKSMEYIPALEEDILLLHGDLIFEQEVLEQVIKSQTSCMVIDKTIPLPEKDFKAVLIEERINTIGIHCFDKNSYAAQPLYKMLRTDWNLWKTQIHEFCLVGKDNVYAEESLNELTKEILLTGIDIKGLLCGEVDNQEDFIAIKEKLRWVTQ